MSKSDDPGKETDLLHRAILAHRAGQGFLHNPDLKLSDWERQAARDNLVMLQRVIDGEVR